MDRSTQVTLITETYGTATDDIGQLIPTETETTVFGNVSSIRYEEWHQAGQNGIKPEYVVKMFSPEYSGQEVVKFNGERYAVYRTYLAKNEIIELYLQKKAGV